ncbi:hypothetical protein N0V82_009065 [Gnomoniopsis sp. IMI 355080]|nr:hypothetical protein N0V82_009065 [Gnomoniopsis sp. IMI 355080]
MDGTPAPNPASDFGSSEKDIGLLNRANSPSMTESTEVSNTALSDSQTNPTGVITERAEYMEASSLIEDEQPDELETSKACPRCPASFRAGEEPLYAFPVRRREKYSASSKRALNKYNGCDCPCRPLISSVSSALTTKRKDKEMMVPILAVPTTTPVEPAEDEDEGVLLRRRSSAPSRIL